MSKQTLKEDTTENLMQEVYSRVQSGIVPPEAVVSLTYATIDCYRIKIQEYNDLNSDLEVSLVAALGKKSTMYGFESREQFITGKLTKWHKHLRFLHGYTAKSKSGDTNE